MLTGHHAYNTLSSDFETRSNIANTPFPKLSKHSKKSFPAKLQEILDHATDRNMMKRYQSCREFRKDLENLLPSASRSHTIISSNKTDNIFITVGREGCDIIIDDPLMKVSRNHLDIAYKQFTGGRYYVITDHSSNGTLVNGKKISRNESENIPADGSIPTILLACDSNYSLDWSEVQRLISEKIKAQSSTTEDPVGLTQMVSEPLSEPPYEATDFENGPWYETPFWQITKPLWLAIGIIILTIVLSTVALEFNRILIGFPIIMGIYVIQLLWQFIKNLLHREDFYN
jgi:pSer/pThr/pTyr-binding forkhead associated (FHA) protein